MKIHKDFKLNGEYFSSSEKLLNYSQNYTFIDFMCLWFSEDDFIEVKTSGSTGKPKIISLKKEYMVNSAKATGKFFNLSSKTKSLLCLPTDYIAGKMMLVRAMVLGWEIDIVEPSSKVKIDKEYDFSAMVPLQLQNSLADIHKIKKLIIGGGVLADDLIDKVENVSTQIFATYGMTETITHIAVRKIINCSDFEKNYYQLLPNIKIYIDERNCLVIQADKIMDEVIKTNDIVSLISGKHFEWLGRFDNVINSGGIKLFPEKIEQKLVIFIEGRFFVTGINDNFLGEKLVLIVEGKKRELKINYEAFSKYEIPKKIFFVEEFIETDTKKIQRKKTLDLVLLP